MSVSSERVPISKRTRFRIFDRDNFTCRYCGKSPPAIKLVVDHVLPVSRGGTNDDDNLIASCVECNQGKGPKALQSAGPAAEHDAGKMAQEWLEQVDAAILAAKAAKARSKLRDSICGYYCKVTGEKSMRRASLSALVVLVYEFDADSVLDWIDSAYAAVGRNGYFKEVDIIKYVCGCARNVRTGAQ